ncbi:MAG: T9SS type A sorting domain-containing protein [Saprospiraceae bacterium]|nr:T9SS type A sorting domain-containing protein [Saprospiraceae bacterium]
MKQFILLVLVFILPQLSLAQIEVEVLPDPLVFEFELEGNDPFQSVFAPVIIKNISIYDTLAMVWVREVISAPEEWSSFVCDYSQCFPSYMDSNWMPPATPIEDIPVLAPGEESVFNLYVHTNQVPGEAVIQFCIYDLYDLDTPIICPEFNITVSGFTAVSDKEISSLQVYPNPTTDFFMLGGDTVVDQVVVYNLLGRQVRSFHAYQNARYDLSGLPDGIYLVSLLNEEAGTLKTVRLSKRAFRP